jgi:hypothetical protein
MLRLMLVGKRVRPLMALLLLAACHGHSTSSVPAPSAIATPMGHIVGRAVPCFGPTSVPPAYVLPVTLLTAAGHRTVMVQKVKQPFDFRFDVPADAYVIVVQGDTPVPVSLLPGQTKHADVPSVCR